MKLKKGNIFNETCDAICITTNGFVKKNGECVMGRGIAKAIKQYLPNIAKDLGTLIKTKGNKVHLIYDDINPNIISYPVKPIEKICTSHDDYVSHMRFNIGDTICGWACKADIAIIETSAYELIELANKQNYHNVILPYVGCGAGELDWNNTVYPLLSTILDDRFTCMTF